MTETGTFTANFDGLEWVGSAQHARLSDIKAQGDKASDPPVQEYFSFEWGPEFQILKLNLQRGERVAFEIEFETILKSYPNWKYQRALRIGALPANLRRVPSEKQ